MGKKRPIVAVAIFSDEDEKVTGDRSSSSLRSRSAAPSKSSRRGGSCKKPNVGRSKAHSCSRSEEVAEFNKLSEDFGECLSDFRAVPGLKSTNMEEIWVDKYKPHSFAELAVHKKKVDEVKGWLEGRLMTSEDGFGNSTLIITGQAGVGKSACFCSFKAKCFQLICSIVHISGNTSQYRLYSAFTNCIDYSQ